MPFSFKKEHILPVEGPSLLVPFILIVSCFALWGLANNLTGPVVAAFSKIFSLSLAESMLIPAAFYLGYFVMAFPAARFIERRSFHAGVLVGLGLFAAGTLLFIPARWIGAFAPFLVAYFILTCGLSFLETSCNPYIYRMGPEETAIQRLNLAQAFNPIGALLGLFAAMALFAPHNADAQLSNSPSPQLLNYILLPYLLMGAVTLLLLLLLWRQSTPQVKEPRSPQGLVETMRELLAMSNYRSGVIALFFYEGAQVACWTFILQYGTRVFVAEGMELHAAETLAQEYNIVAMLLFAVARFVCLWLMRYVHSSRLLAVLGIVGATLLVGVVLFPGRSGVYCLVAVSACLSLMFPTIYGTALRGVGSKVKTASAGLITAILGATLLPSLQAFIIKSDVMLLGLPAVNLSFLVPIICLVVVALYGHRTYVRHHILKLEA